MISVLCPSRGHPDLLLRSVESLLTRAAGQVEILVGADPDDDRTMDLWQDGFIPEQASVWVAPERHGYERLHLYYQELARMAAGDWLLVWGDDCVMCTDRWDEAIEELPPEILVADLGSTYSPLCCFPAIRRRAVEALGRFSSDNPHVDTFWGDIGTWAGVIRQVGVFVSASSPVKGNPHDFYSPAHQAGMRACAQQLRELTV